MKKWQTGALRETSLQEQSKTKRFKNTVFVVIDEGERMKFYNWAIIFLLVLISIGGVFAYSNINGNLSELSEDVKYVNQSIVDLKNNAGFVSVIKELKDSVFMIIVQPLPERPVDFTTAVYVDETGERWSKGTAFSVTDDGFIVTATHIFPNNINNTKIQVVFQDGKKEDVLVKQFFVNVNLDIIILETNLSIKPVKLAKEEQVPVGAKIGFIGYPLKDQQVINSGIISSVEKVLTDPATGKQYYIYTLDSFVNSGNSGGPVFFSDTGEVVGIINAKRLADIEIPLIDVSKLSDETKLVLQYQTYLFGQLLISGQTGTGYSAGVNEYIFDVIGK